MPIPQQHTIARATPPAMHFAQRSVVCAVWCISDLPIELPNFAWLAFDLEAINLWRPDRLAQLLPPAHPRQTTALHARARPGPSAPVAAHPPTTSALRGLAQLARQVAQADHCAHPRYTRPPGLPAQPRSTARPPSTPAA